MVSSQLAFRISLGAAAVVLLLTLFGLFQPPLALCGALAKNYPPVIAFELSRSVADLHAIFGDAPNACRTALAAKMDVLTWIDCLVFIPAYGAFLLFFLIGLAPRDERSAEIAFVIVAVSLLADYIENVCLFCIAAFPDDPGFWLSLLPFATGLKWLGLGAAAAIAGTILLRAGRLNYPAALLCAVSFLSAALALANPHLFGPYVSNGIALGWIVFLIVDIRQSLPMAQLEIQNGA